MLQKICISIVLLLPAFVTPHFYQKLDKTSNECDCQCSKFLSGGTTRELSLCQKLARLEEEFFTAKREMERRTHYIKEITYLKERLEIQEDNVETLQGEIESLKKERSDIANERLPTPSALIMKPEDEMMGDSNRDTRMTDTDQELVKNVSSLLAKVEEVETLTTKVQEELKSERRVRRHLEEDLNETRSSIKILDDKLYNMTSPMDSRVTHVEEVVFSTLENMNKTFFEDHLQKLYYKVDGVVYKNETKKLDERLDFLETEVTNSTAMQEFTDEIKTLAETLRGLNQTATEKFTLVETRMDVQETKTKKLQDLMVLVEAELHNVTNSTEVQEFRDEIKSMDEKLWELNQTAIEKLTEAEIRLVVVETKTRTVEELADLNDQMEIIMNITELMQGGMPQLWTTILDNQNMTAQIKKEMDNQTVLLSNVIENVLKLDNLTAEIDALKYNASKPDTLLLDLQKNMKFIAADVAIMENRIHDLKVASETGMKDVHRKIDKLNDTMDSSLSALVTHFIDQNMKQDSVETTTDYTIDPYHTENAAEESPRSRSTDAETEPCSLPSINDTHLLISMNEGPDGDQQLEFGCRPIGRYVLDKPSVPLRCIDGEWIGPLPTCVRLLDEMEIDDIARYLSTKNPCLFGQGEFPDPTSCSSFFKCWNGNSERMSCPPTLAYDKMAKRCDYPRVANCQPYISEETEQLRNLIPLIRVEPDRIDKPYGLMGTSDAGDLIVYPGTRFHLNCIFPVNRWGPATWIFLPNFTGKEVTTIVGRNSLSLSVIAHSREDSGIYTCRSPFGKQNSVTVIVQAVTCPAVELGPGSPLSDAFYRPIPDGTYRVLTTPVEYVCDDGTMITAYCQANGKWSRPLPTAEECSPRRSELETIWGCQHINTENHPDLILHRRDSDMTITFKCAGNSYLIGSAYTRCYNGSWTHTSLPRCQPRRY